MSPSGPFAAGESAFIPIAKLPAVATEVEDDAKLPAVAAPKLDAEVEEEEDDDDGVVHWKEKKFVMKCKRIHLSDDDNEDDDDEEEDELLVTGLITTITVHLSAQIHVVRLI